MRAIRAAAAIALASVVPLAPAAGPAAGQSSSPAASVTGLPIPTCVAASGIDAAPSGTTPAPVGSPLPTRGELTVFAAASLRNAFEALAPAYAAGSGLAPIHSFDASSALRAQIEEAAPADVFASADVANVQRLLDAGLAQGPVAFACNQLTIIVPTGNPGAIAAATDLGRPGVLVIAAGPEVPITRYAQRLIANLGIADSYAANIVTEEDNVAAVRAKIEAGEGDAAIVYRTDALASGDAVEQVPVPAELNVPATYAAAAIVESDQPADAAGYLRFLTGPVGQAALVEFGFLPAPTPGG